MQMKSAKELKGEETISQGNELTDCKDGTSAWPPNLGAPLSIEDRVRDWRDWRGILSSHSHGHKLCPPACCLTVSLWLQNSGLPFDFLRVFLLFVQICSGSTGFLLTCRTNFLGPSKKALALLINPNPILHIRLTRYRNTDYLFFLCYLVQVSKELKKFLIILLCWYI